MATIELLSAIETKTISEKAERIILQTGRLYKLFEVQVAIQYQRRIMKSLHNNYRQKCCQQLQNREDEGEKSRLRRNLTVIFSEFKHLIKVWPENRQARALRDRACTLAFMPMILESDD